MSIKIVSTTGVPTDVQIIDTETGENLMPRLGVEKIEVIIANGQPNRAVLTLEFVQLEIAADYTSCQPLHTTAEQDSMAACLMVDSGYDGVHTR